MELTRARLRELLSYDPDTGAFRWLKRPVRPGNEQADSCWNAAWAGKRAGTISDGYWKIWIGSKPNGRQFRAARLAFLYMTGRMPRREVDHINRKRHDDRWSNLRQATRSENLVNGRHKNPKKGTWRLPNGRWRSTIFYDGQRIHLGVFDKRAEAIAAYRKAKAKHFGEFSD